ncbi:MAG: VanZ family protein [Candidatus Marinimicrobia bacterium]|nr:VanZ family protein [Candidatus Neomarinimicrobiota bacterium]
MNIEKYNFQLLSAAFALLILGLSSIPANYLPQEIFFSWDKVYHMIEYFIFILLVGMSYITSDERRLRMKWIPYTLRIGLIFPILDELYQSLIPGRYSSWFDVLADLSGVTIGIIVLGYYYEKHLSEKS